MIGRLGLLVDPHVPHPSGQVGGYKDEIAV
jgi:hypothetical protein